MSYIFISYSHEDSDYARTYAAELQRRGFKVWLDKRIDYGDRWFREITRAIRACNAFSVVMTPAAEESEWVEKEILVAQKHEKPIFPLLLKGREFDLLINTQYANVVGGGLPPDEFFARLAGAVLVERPVKVNTTSLNEKLVARLEVKKVLTDELARGIREYLQNPALFSLKWRVGEIEVSLSAPKQTYEITTDRIEAIILQNELPEQKRVHLERDGWYSREDLFTTVWIATDEPELPGEIAADLIAANEILGVPVEAIGITSIGT